MSAIRSGAIAVAFSTLIGTGCTAGDDAPSATSPPTTDPIVLRLGTGDPQGRPDSPVVERFAGAVEDMSGGDMQVEIVWEAAGNSTEPDGFERGVAMRVQDGELELGWIATRAWDTIGVTSFQALQAPFLITDQELLSEVLASPMGDEMLAGLPAAGLVGLGMFPDGLRYPLGYAAPMASLDDLDRATIRLVPSEATKALIRALGGRPVYKLNGDELDAAITSGDLDGTEISLGLAPSVAQDVAPKSVITGNVVLFPRVNTLFAGQAPMESLSDEQRAILVAATEDAQAYAAELATEDVGPFCDAGGEVAIASKAEVAALNRAARPVYRMLEADPQTKAFIEEIQGMREGEPPADPPPSCSTG